MDSEKMNPSDPRRGRRWPWAVALGVSTLSVWFAAHFTAAAPPPPTPNPGLSVEKEALGLTPTAPEWRFVRVGVAGVAATRWTDPVPARIAIDETRMSKLGTPLAGRISRVFVEMGQRVAAGDPLFSVASPDIAELRSGKEKARLDLEAARVTLDRVRSMVQSRALAAKEELSAQQQFGQAELAAKLADAKLAALHVGPEGDNEFTVRAPRTGVVVEKNLVLGQQAAPDAAGTLVVVADLTSVWVVADVFEAQATDLREGAAAEVTSPSLPEAALSGRVEMVSAVVDPSRHTVPVRVRLANPDGLLRPNVYARVRFAAPSRTVAAAEVPTMALVSDGEHQYVFVQEKPGRFVRREVTTGPAREGRVSVLTGLAPGETVVEEGAILLDNQLALAE